MNQQTLENAKIAEAECNVTTAARGSDRGRSIRPTAQNLDLNVLTTYHLKL